MTPQEIANTASDEMLKAYFDAGGTSFKVLGFDTYRSSDVGCVVTSYRDFYIHPKILTWDMEGSNVLTELETEFAILQLLFYESGELNRLGRLRNLIQNL
jgi:hypothetical protein